eukprot:TRINITY_DN8000_c0_g1_i1.p1 TRINITY_DN8000_c0_g1~~TRINITY_DN8000_c0_g1_i1.p1  ORF type:complete len:67 (+),score=4.25 TRINITY_DN8000_c0_g1_i1:310-510(+)
MHPTNSLTHSTLSLSLSHTHTHTYTHIANLQQPVCSVKSSSEGGVEVSTSNFYCNTQNNFVHPVHP